MTETIKTIAQAYMPPQKTQNIAELDKVHVEETILHEIVKQGTPEEWEQYYLERDGVKYVIKNSVLDQLKTFLEVNPEMTYFKVVRKGSGMETKYTVVPLGN